MFASRHHLIQRDFYKPNPRRTASSFGLAGGEAALCWQQGDILGLKIPPGKVCDAHRVRLWFPEAAQVSLNVTQTTL